MNAVTLLALPADAQYSEAEDALIARELAHAYWLDECAGTNPEVLRLAEKVRLRMREAETPEAMSPEEPIP